MSSSNRLIVSILVVAGLALAFWMLLLSPKREEADKLSSEAGRLQVALGEAQSKAAEATAARQEFPSDYRQLVVLGQAVPAGDETSSLLVELSTIAQATHVKFDSIQLESSGSSSPESVSTPPPAPSSAESSTGAVPASATVAPTEAAAALLPLGASIGPAGLAVMPYGLNFSGNFFQIANFIRDVDSLVHTRADSKVGIDGRLVTVNGFALTANESEEEKGKSKSPTLNATFSVTTYVTPPSQGTTAGATESAPASPASAAGASSAASESASATESSSSSSSEAVAAR